MLLLLRISIVFSLCFSTIFANDAINIDVSTDKVSLGNSLQLNVTLGLTESAGDKISLEIPGIENFNIFSQSRNYNYQNINGETQGFLQYTLDLQTVTLGNFLLGPVKVLSGSGEVIDDVILNISVIDDIASLSMKQDTQEVGENISEDSGVTGRIRGDRNVAFPWLLLISGLVFIGVFYYLLKNILYNKKNIEENNSHASHACTDAREELQKYFVLLGQENEDITSQKFFKKYNSGIRQALLLEGVKNAHKITLSELALIKDIIDNPIYKVFKKSYKYEYCEKSISPETRKKYISNILGLLIV